MRRLQIRDAEVMKIAIRQEIGRSDESRYDHRLHGLLLVASGQSCRGVAQLLGEDPTTVQRWVRRFERHGFEGLRDGAHPGRPRSLDQRQWQRLQREVRRDPQEFGHAQGLWDGRLLSEHLKKHYAIRLGARQCQRMFHQMGFRLRKPRPQVAQADPVRVAAVKKTAPTRAPR
jgi:transposase